MFVFDQNANRRFPLSTRRSLFWPFFWNCPTCEIQPSRRKWRFHGSSKRLLALAPQLPKHIGCHLILVVGHHHKRQDGTRRAIHSPPSKARPAGFGQGLRRSASTWVSVSAKWCSGFIRKCWTAVLGSLQYLWICCVWCAICRSHSLWTRSILIM